MYRMIDCASILVTSYGPGPLILIVFQSLTCLFCFVVSFIFAWKRCKTQKCSNNKQTNRNKSKQSNFSVDNGRFQKYFTAQLIVVSCILSLTGTVLIVKYIFDLHADIPLSTKRRNYTSWTSYVESKCNVNLTTVTNTMFVLISVFLANGYIGILSLYFTRLVLLLNGSLFSISKKSTMTFYFTFAFIFILDTAIIPVNFLVDKNVSIIIETATIGVSFALIGTLAVFLQRLLKQQFTSLIRMALNVSQMHMSNEMIASGHESTKHTNININKNSSGKIQGLVHTLNRLTILFMVSLTSTAVSAFIFIIFVVTGLYHSSNYAPVFRGIVILISVNDILINILCIVLQFPYMDEKFGIYSKCCGSCHSKYSRKYINQLTQK